MGTTRRRLHLSCNEERKKEAFAKIDITETPLAIFVTIIKKNNR